jgi:hypothetical protein
MSAWMSIAVAAAAQAVLELVGAAVFVWREQAHARANCRQIEAAAQTGALVRDRRGQQPELLVVPLGARRDV